MTSRSKLLILLSIISLMRFAASQDQLPNIDATCFRIINQQNQKSLRYNSNFTYGENFNLNNTIPVTMDYLAYSPEEIFCAKQMTSTPEENYLAYNIYSRISHFFQFDINANSTDGSDRLKMRYADGSSLDDNLNCYFFIKQTEKKFEYYIQLYDKNSKSYNYLTLEGDSLIVKPFNADDNRNQRFLFLNVPNYNFEVNNAKIYNQEKNLYLKFNWSNVSLTSNRNDKNTTFNITYYNDFDRNAYHIRTFKTSKSFILDVQGVGDPSNGRTVSNSGLNTEVDKTFNILPVSIENNKDETFYIMTFCGSALQVDAANNRLIQQKWNPSEPLQKFAILKVD